jgi:hypothetical protein
MRYSDLGEGLVSLTIRPTHNHGITPSLGNVRPYPLGVPRVNPNCSHSHRRCTMVGSLAHSYSGSRTLGCNCCSPHSIPLSQCAAPTTAHTAGKQRMHYLWHTSPMHPCSTNNARKQLDCIFRRNRAPLQLTVGKSESYSSVRTTPWCHPLAHQTIFLPGIIHLTPST